jgi:hypothetical protein
MNCIIAVYAILAVAWIVGYAIHKRTPTKGLTLKETREFGTLMRMRWDGSLHGRDYERYRELGDKILNAHR